MKIIEIPEGYEARIEGDKVVLEPIESEDEKIRKSLIHHFKNKTKPYWNEIAVKDIIAYLEKQKEQKPAEGTALQKAFINSKIDFTLEEKCDASDYAEVILPTSVAYGEDDEEYKLHKIIEAAFIAGQKKEQKPAEWSDDFEENIRILLNDKLTWHSKDGSMSTAVLIDDKQLKDIVSGIWFYVGKEALKYPNKKLNVSEWSEEDETAFGDLMWCMEQARKSAKDENDMGNIWFAENWVKNRLKSIRPLSHWRPSEEQMEWLEQAVRLSADKPAIHGVILSLYNDLKKLM